jgi:hypothetical protein
MKPGILALMFVCGLLAAGCSNDSHSSDGTGMPLPDHTHGRSGPTPMPTHMTDHKGTVPPVYKNY